ncbi:hypothetical protein X963_4914 [Burkholderia pseudomallei MSHR7498]|nr:hypothetical protein X963_4914 [Burkholderia pseudomallei MSHR7498]
MSAVQRARATGGERRPRAAPTLDSRFPTLDSRFPIPDSRLPTPDSRLPTPDSRLPTPDSRRPAPTYPVRGRRRVAHRRHCGTEWSALSAFRAGSRSSALPTSAGGFAGAAPMPLRFAASPPGSRAPGSGVGSSLTSLTSLS